MDFDRLRRAGMRAIVVLFVALVVLWLTADRYDTEPIAAATIALCVLGYDAWPVLRDSWRARGRGGVSRPIGVGFVVACVCAAMVCSARMVDSVWRPELVRTTRVDGDVEHVHTSRRLPWQSVADQEIEHARAMVAAHQAKE